MLVFVYGTLKKGYGNNTLLNEAKFVGKDILPNYKAYNCGFPIAWPDKESNLSGEVYEIKEDDEHTLVKLDRLESEGAMYNRKIATTLSGREVSFYEGVSNFWDTNNLKLCHQTDSLYKWG